MLPKTISSIQDIQLLLTSNQSVDWSAYGCVKATYKDDLVIFNYTREAGEWNFFETVSRGLIINKVTGEIVARPFDKFWNWLEGGRTAEGHIITITEKLDGSMGVLYRQNGQYKIATRGSFTGDQAVWATNYLQNRVDTFGIPDDYTLIFEIIYPDNRIVVNYGDREELVLLAVRNRFTGEYLSFFNGVVPLAEDLGLFVPKVYSFNNVSEILEAAGSLDANSEGWVVEFSDGSRWKFKGDRYKEVQKFLMGLSYKSVLKAYMEDQIDALLMVTPEEYHQQIIDWVEDIDFRLISAYSHIHDVFNNAPKFVLRKHFAHWAKEEHKDISDCLFRLYDGKDVKQQIYRYEFKEML